MGLDVQICRAPAQIAWGLVDHEWIKTSSIEAGMGGPADNPGDQYELPYTTNVFVTNHAGQSKNRKGASCKVVDADENKVNALLQIGTPLGSFSAWNNCQTFANSVIRQATPPPAPTPQLPPVHIFPY